MLSYVKLGTIIHLASRGVSIPYHVLLYILFARNTHERGANASGHVYVKRRFTRPHANLSQRRKNVAGHTIP